MSTPRKTKEKAGDDDATSVQKSGAGQDDEAGKSAAPPPGDGLDVVETIQHAALFDDVLSLAAAASGSVRVRALRNVEHDGCLYGPEAAAGDELDLAPDQFEVLHPTGAIERM